MEGEGLTPLIPTFANSHGPKPAQSISQPHNVLSLTSAVFALPFAMYRSKALSLLSRTKVRRVWFHSPLAAVIIQTIHKPRAATLAHFAFSPHSALMCFELHTYEVQTVPSRIVTVTSYKGHGSFSYQLMPCDFRF